MTASRRFPVSCLSRGGLSRWLALPVAIGVLAAGAAAGFASGRVVSAQTTAATLVVCAPGYPGSTGEAQSAMDALSAVIASAAGWKTGELKAVYHETEAEGLQRLASADAAVALVPLPFWLQHEAALKLEPVMQAIEQGGQPAERWTLVAGAGAVARPADLAGYEIVSLAGYAPRFVRGPALGAWGDVPSDVRITFSNAALTALRRASSGAKVALLLDRAQASAMPTLPFAKKLQVVTVSPPLPVSVLASVGGRLSSARQLALVRALSSLTNTPAGRDALAGVRLSGFVAADREALSQLREAFARVKE